MKFYQHQKIRALCTVVALSGLVGAGVGYLLDRQVLPGAIIGTIVSLVFTSAELYVFQSKAIQRCRFATHFLLSFSFYLLVVVLTILPVICLVNGVSPSEVLESQRFKIAMLISVVLSFSFTFGKNVIHIIGAKVALNLLISRYYHPIEEVRMVMFLDLNSSTTIAEEIGHLRFHAFLNDFFSDISDAIWQTRGEVYKYVGDEVIVTWDPVRGAKNANCIRCFFHILEDIARVKERYLHKYGVSPEFKAGLHIGKVTVGEIGLIRHEIALLGDTINTTARILSEAGERKKKLLISEDILKSLRIPENFSRESIGKIKLKGKEHEIELWSIESIETK
jgi:adenylate cyclase